MVLNPKDYVRASDGTGTAVRAVVASKREPNDLYLNVDSVAHWPNKFIATAGTLDEATGTLDPDTFTEFYGHLEGSIIVIEEFCPGYSDYGNEPYDVVVIKPATAWADAVAEVAEAGIPAGGTTGQALVKKSDDDGDVEWGSGGGVSIISKEVPTGAINGTNKSYTTNLPYVGGSLQVYVNGLAQSGFITESTPTTGVFTLDVAPTSGSTVVVSYQFAPSETGNADTVDGYHASTSGAANTIPVVDSDGKLSVAGTTAVTDNGDGWKDLPLNSGFNANGVGGSYGPQYRKIGDVVYWRGIVAKDSGNITTATPPFSTLPAEIRPTSKTVYFDVSLGGSASSIGTIRFALNSSGAVAVTYTVGTASGYAVLDGICYPL